MGPSGSTLCAVVVLLCAMSSCAQSHGSHGVLLSTRGAQLGPSSITKISSGDEASLQPIRITLPPTSSISNTTSNSTSSNGTLKLDVCLDCVTFMTDNLQTLINIVTKIGITDTCAKICSQLNDSVDIIACESLCDTIGIEKFWQMFVSAGINPIWACEMVNACKVGQSPAVTLLPAVSGVTPPHGPPGTTFTFSMQFTVINETGVGENAFVVYYPANSDHQLGFISQQVFSDYTPGNYEVSLTFPTNISFNTGKYLVIFDLCSGACGLDPDPVPFAQGEYSFNITGVLEK